MNSISLVIVTAAVIYGVSAVTCPRCTNENDWRTCTETQACSNEENSCQFVVENQGDRHRVTYHCTHNQDCQEHQTQHCDISVPGHCEFCCNSIASCTNQREGVFDSLA